MWQRAELSAVVVRLAAAVRSCRDITMFLPACGKLIIIGGAGKGIQKVLGKGGPGIDQSLIKAGLECDSGDVTLATVKLNSHSYELYNIMPGDVPDASLSSCNFASRT